MILAEGLRKVFDPIVAVEDVHLEVRPGEIVALLGPNGAGKTTTVRMLAALLRPTAGRAIVAGYDVIRHPQEVRRRVGLLTELPGLYLRMTGEEYLAFFADLYEVPHPLLWQRINPWLDRLGLREALGRRIATYSKGMRQKLALLRAFLHEPPVLLLDEPTSAMDPESAQVAREMIRSFAENGHAVLLCTHNLYEAESLAHRIAILHRGRIQIEGSPSALRERVLGPPVYELRLAGPVEAAWDALSPHLPIVARGPDWIRYRAQDPERENPRLLAAVVARGIPVLSLSEVHRPLEAVYQQILNGAIPDQPSPGEESGRIAASSRTNPTSLHRLEPGTGIPHRKAAAEDLRRWVRGTWAIFRRDVLDILRDWRLMTPLALLLVISSLLALYFIILSSAILNSAGATAGRIARLGIPLISARLLPLLALMIGLLPVSASRIIALDTFAGEKERRTLEPLLAAPLSDLQLYLGKGLAALTVSTVISLLAVTLYLLILMMRGVWTVSAALIFFLYAILILNAITMVSTSIVTSTQSNSVRGASLLSHLISLPFSMLLTFEWFLLFLGIYQMLILVLCIPLIYTILLIRMGIALFNREQLLSAEFDTLDPGRILRRFWQAFREGDPAQPAHRGWGLIEQPIRRSAGALATLAALGVMGLGIAWLWLPPLDLPVDTILRQFPSIGLSPGQGREGIARFLLSPWGIFLHNLLMLAMNTFLSVTTLGLWTAFYPVGWMGMIGVLLRALFASDPRLGIAGILGILPHGILELPAVGLVLAGALRLGLTLLTPPGPRSLRDRWILAWADWLKLLLLAIPLLLLAAWVEVHVTPRLVLWWLRETMR